LNHLTKKVALGIFDCDGENEPNPGEPIIELKVAFLFCPYSSRCNFSITSGSV